MKKKLLIMLLVLLLLVSGGLYLWSHRYCEPEIVVTDCDIADYQRVIERFPYEGNVGPVPDAETAVARAKELWLEEYGVINGKPYDPTGGRPIKVGYDAEHDCWVVIGTLPKNAFGAVPVAIIQGDGTVLAVGMA